MTPLAEALAIPMATPKGADWDAIALAFVDTLACIRAGLAETTVLQLAQAQAQGGQTLATQAAHWATAAHAQDWDDYEALGSTHPSAVLVPVALALGADATTAKVFAAYAAGYRAIGTLGYLLGYGHYRAGWHATSTLGVFGAASVAAHLLNLSPSQHQAALNIAASRAGGLKGQFGGPVKALHAGFAVSSGIEAALLAKAGITPVPDVLTNTDGFLQVFGPPQNRRSGPSDLRGLADNPVFAKPWPSCAYTHRAIEAAVRIGPLPLKEIAGITLKIAAPYAQVAGHRHPQSVDEARFSVTFCVAVALLDGGFSTFSVADETRKRADLVKAEAMVQLDTYPLPTDIGDMSPEAPDTLTVRLHSGAVRQETVANAKGGPAKPLGREDIIGKFVESGGTAAAAARFLDADPDAPFEADLIQKQSLP